MTYRVFPLILLLLMTACSTDFVDDMDQRLATLVQDQQQSTLGDSEAVDPEPTPVNTTSVGPENNVYETDPPTLNPPADELPVEVNPEAQESTLGKTDQALYLDDMTDAIEMNLPEALAYAIKNSRQYRGRKEDLYLAAISLLTEQHLWGPRFFDTFTATYEGVPDTGDHTDTLRLLNTLRVTQRLPYGGNISARALIGYVEQIRQKSTATFEGGQYASLILEGDIPLLRDGGKTAREALIQAERNLIYETRSFERFRRTFMVDIATRYYSLLLSESGIRNLELQVASLERIAKRTKALADSGRLPYIEVQRAQQESLFSRNNLLIARENLALSFDQFKIQIGMKPTQPLKIKPVEVIIPTPILEPEKAIQTAHWYRLDLQTAKDQIKDSQRAVKVAKNQLLADFDITGRISFDTDSDKRNAGLDFEVDESSYSAGLLLDFPLDRQNEQYNYRRALISLERRRRNYDLVKDQITQDVRDAIRQIQQAKVSYDIQELNVQLARRRQIGVQLRSRTLRVEEQVNAQDRLLDAMNRRDLAMRDIRVSVLRYLLNTGQMRVTGTGNWMPPAKLQPIPVPEAQPEGEMVPEQLDIPDEQDAETNVN